MKTNQSGRSMIEMLGVLAIIGVMSIGGIWGYKLATYHFQANNILDDVNRFAFVIEEKKDKLNDGNVSKSDFVETAGFEMSAYNNREKGYYHVDVADVSDGTCQQILGKGKETYKISVNDIFYMEDDGICQSETGSNTVKFYFGNTDGLCNACQDGDVCCNECPCLTGQTCEEDISSVHASEMCCSDGKVNCGGYCVDNKGCDASKNLVFDNNRCGCVCAEPEKMESDGTGGCQCKTINGGSGMQLTMKNGKCVCADESYTYIPSLNKCSQLVCPNGDGGNCSLDSWLCGHNCSNTSDGTRIECTHGQCRVDLCPAGTTYVNAQPSSYYYYWLCQLNEKPLCYATSIRGSHSYYCFSSTSAKSFCCRADSNGTCQTGLCETDYCTNNFTNASYVEELNNGNDNQGGGCHFSNIENVPQGISCYPQDSAKTKWTCLNNPKQVCGSNCDKDATKVVGDKTLSFPASCGNCNNRCGNTGYDVNGEYCCAEATLSSGIQKTICVDNDRNEFYLDTGAICATSCSRSVKKTTDNNGNPVYTLLTTCSQCINDTVCAAGWTFDYGERTDLIPGLAGCVKDGVKCIQYPSGPPAACKTANNVGCGSYCGLSNAISNSNCGIWSQKSCAPSLTQEDVTKPACIYGRQIFNNAEARGESIPNTETDYDCWCAGDVVCNSSVTDCDPYDAEDPNPHYCCPSGQKYQGGKCVVK